MRVLNVKRSDSDWGVAAVAHLLTSSEWMQNRQKHRVQRRRPEEETSGKDWLSLRCASRSFALKAEQRNGERREAEVQREPAREKEEEVKERVKFPWTIPGVPTRLIKLWLLESLNYITQLELWFWYFSVCNESLSEGWQARKCGPRLQSSIYRAENEQTGKSLQRCIWTLICYTYNNYISH